ncbi:MAG: UDP-N-acetylmuramate dehydrogenase [Cyanobacteria bacterium SIG29]|nr:UDP-N-acetylmuramate dehydrogenase [Cyanobacteria bacterium SIG29]
MQIIENYQIKNDTTFRIGGTVSKVALPETCDELIELLKSKEYELIFGNCSNTLFSSEKINKNIILTKNLNEFSFNGTTLKVSCGTKGPIIAKECQARGLTGLEFLIGFPGSFGGMIHMNSSAHNQSISDTFVSARIFDLETNEIKTYYKKDMNFEYRNSILNNENLILIDAIFELKEGIQEEINSTIEHNLEFRKQHQPSLKYGNGGSTFKNPKNDSAGRLLDECGMKGQTQGGAKVFEGHANFVLNFYNATSLDIITLIYRMQIAVKEKFEIKLMPEIKYIGDKGTKEYRLWEMITKENTH